MKRNMKYNILLALLACIGLASCKHDVVGPEKGDIDDVLAEIQAGYSLTLKVTLDQMGGTTYTKGDYTVDELARIENYIDPEKFRVLFFDNDDKFLFESKSRWVKLLSETSDFTSWLVSVPVFSYGNDTGQYDWDWPTIRKALTKETEEEEKYFKIAILANRPEWEFFPELEDNTLGGSRWFDNSGPFWTKDDTGKKDIFDLHHCQWDPIYTSKGRPSGYTGAELFYDFIMGKDNSGRSTMSATASWVDWTGDTNNSNDPNRRQGFRYPILPSYDYPIPMYGVQKFDAIMNWTEGTPFNLSSLTAAGSDNEGYNHNSISMLRSVVKMELVIPRTIGTINHATIWYANLYSRCEPMDVWTPTDVLWEKDHADSNDWDPATKCEWQSIMEYGPIARDGDSNNNPPVDADRRAFQQRIAWFYGSWLDKNWGFGSLGQEYVRTQIARYGNSPRIFNPCTQRNNTIYCDENVTFHDASNYRYIVYLGERNINDPSNLGRMGNHNSGQPTVMYWNVSVTKNGMSYRYAFPITDYQVAGNPALQITREEGAEIGNLNCIQGYENKSEKDYPDVANSPTHTVLHEGYMQWIHSNRWKNYDDKWNQNTTGAPLTAKQRPWPLIRNHVYRITVGASTSTRSGDDELSVSCEDLHSTSIKFQ